MAKGRVRQILSRGETSTLTVGCVNSAVRPARLTIRSNSVDSNHGVIYAWNLMVPRLPTRGVALEATAPTLHKPRRSPAIKARMWSWGRLRWQKSTSKAGMSRGINDTRFCTAACDHQESVIPFGAAGYSSRTRPTATHATSCLLPSPRAETAVVGTAKRSLGHKPGQSRRRCLFQSLSSSVGGEGIKGLKDAGLRAWRRYVRLCASSHFPSPGPPGVEKGSKL